MSPSPAWHEIAEMLDFDATEVASIVGFYTLYHDEKAGKYRMQVCNDLPCALRGADKFLKQLCENLGVKVGETTPDGLFTVEAVKCLAACHRAPMFQVQGDGDKVTYHENQTVERTMELDRTGAPEARPKMRRADERTYYICCVIATSPISTSWTFIRQNGGFEAFEKAVTTMQPADITARVKDANMRGRGGAGFPTGVKWSFLPNNLWPHYVVCNADESEPGTFKDREIMESNPFQFLEGVVICPTPCRPGWLCLPARRVLAGRQDPGPEDRRYGSCRLCWAITCLAPNILCACTPTWAPGAYICGEETALLESLEGKRGQPRLRPPFPAVVGLYGKPTVINNVETLANLPPIIVKKARPGTGSFGTEKSPGVKIFSPVRQCQQARQLRTAPGHHLPRPDLQAWRRHSRRPQGQSHHAGRRQPLR